MTGHGEPGRVGGAFTGSSIHAFDAGLRPRRPVAFEDAAHVDGALVVVVSIHGGFRRRVFLSLSSAERALLRAQEAGHEATIVLAKLVPVMSEDGGE